MRSNRRFADERTLYFLLFPVLFSILHVSSFTEDHVKSGLIGVQPDLIPFYRNDDGLRSTLGTSSRSGGAGGPFFTCFSDHRPISFLKVNDDFCDCEDGSDEPATSACNNSVFYCPNVGHVSEIVPSTHVNDGICDCCDGSDEWKSPGGVKCENSCLSLGQILRQKREKEMEVMRKGYGRRLALVEEAKIILNSKRERLNSLVERKKDHESQRDEMQLKVNELEERQQSAIDVFNAREEERRLLEADTKRQMARQFAVSIFHSLINSCPGGGASGEGPPVDLLVVDDIKRDIIFDMNKDGEVSDEEAIFYTANQVSGVDEATFLQLVWPLIKHLYVEEGGEKKNISDDENRKISESDDQNDGEQGVMSDMDIDESEYDEEVENDGKESSREEDEGEEKEISSNEENIEEDDEKSDYATIEKEFAALPGSDFPNEEDKRNFFDKRMREMRAVRQIKNSDRVKDEIVSRRRTHINKDQHHEDTTEHEDNTDMETSQYDAHTQSVIDSTNEAKRDLETLKKSMDAVDREIKEIETLLGMRRESSETSMDLMYGEDWALLPLKDKCLEFSDGAEFTYSVCMFGKSEQRSSNGGSTSLGHFHSASNDRSDQNNLDVALTHSYTGGASCWNGPARSIKVHITCGVEDRLLRVSEPSKCVYEGHMELSGVCVDPDGTRRSNLSEGTSSEQTEKNLKTSHEEL